MNKETPTEEWEKEFDSFFETKNFRGKEWSWNPPDVVTMKNFIRSLLTSRDAELRRKIEALPSRVVQVVFDEPHVTAISKDAVLDLLDKK